ncbi:acetyl-CoA hydrolase/transferase family protein [Microbacterium sp. NIBRBAC000506063]|uniref:acetyl-CoA hydrolase/transferase family protein n=1 Tax=Microbacterium sp. NIBRBAC000506063 TaxID=2734618 RepID=UPI001BB5F8DF|nr:acetyl-CoA hydrolase/transferase C-terminal domain-containing protein [Microbacterium sp. NIBRBAC000506063]QTV80479.1 acetyl-CoA hydrolase/transferase family protein [Microbacterium sp. NIBRBAC000506063]
MQVFAGISYSGEFTPRIAEATRLSSFGAMGEIAQLAAAGLVDVLPVHYVDVAGQLRVRGGAGLVLMIQVAPADTDGLHSLGLAVDYTAELLDVARLVIAEVNDQLPTVGGPSVHRSRIDVAVPISRKVREVASGAVDDVHRAIADNVVQLVPERPVLQLGIGGVPSAVATLLAGKRSGLRVHTGLVGDWLLDLDRQGALDPNAPIVVGGAAGSAVLYDFLASDPRVETRTIATLTRPDVTASIDRLVALNSAVQVDLTGQVNAELAGPRYVGGVGGQIDFLRGAQLSAGGVSIIALPATASGGRRSRIVRDLDGGVVTTPRSGVDFIVTEFGIADLRGQGLAARSEAISAIAAPEFRGRCPGRNEWTFPAGINHEYYNHGTAGARMFARM